MIERILFWDAAKAMGYSSYHGFKEWCNLNGVGLLRDKGSRRVYLIRQEFEFAANKEILSYLTSKYNLELKLNNKQT